MPTRFGNVPWRRPIICLVYGMDGALWWMRLVPVVPAEFLAMLGSAQALLAAGSPRPEHSVRRLALTAAAVLGLAAGQWLRALGVLLAGLLLAYLCYRAAVSQAAEFARIMRVAFDLYRHAILTQMVDVLGSRRGTGPLATPHPPDTPPACGDRGGERWVRDCPRATMTEPPGPDRPTSHPSSPRAGRGIRPGCSTRYACQWTQWCRIQCGPHGCSVLTRSARRGSIRRGTLTVVAPRHSRRSTGVEPHAALLGGPRPALV